MTTAWETAIANALLVAFGLDWLLGVIAILIFSVFVLALRPPGVVSALAIMFFALLVFGSQVGSMITDKNGNIVMTSIGSGGLELSPAFIVGLAILAAIAIIFGAKRLLRDY